MNLQTIGRSEAMSVFSNEADKMSKGVFTNPLPGLQYTCEDLPQATLHGNVVYSVCEHMGNAAYIISIMLNFISG